MKATTLSEYVDLIVSPEEIKKIPKVKFDKLKATKTKKQLRTYLKHHRKVSELQRRRKRGHEISDRQQRQLIRSALTAEDDLRQCTMASIEMVRKNRPFLKYARDRSLEHFDELIVFSNPCYYDMPVRKALLDTGATMRELASFHLALFNRRNADVLRSVYAAETFESNLDRVYRAVGDAVLPESLDDLRESGMVTIEGAGWLLTLGRGLFRVAVGGIVLSMTWPLLLIPPPAPGPHRAAIPVFGLALATAMSGIALVGAGLQEMWEGLGGADLLGPIGDIIDTYTGEYVGNSNTNEMHVMCCAWEKIIYPWNRVALDSEQDGLAQGYDGCAYCLPQYDTG